MGSYGLVIGPAGYQHECGRVFGLLKEIIIQTTRFAANGLHEFKQEFLYSLTMFRFAPDGRDEMTFGGFIRCIHKRDYVDSEMAIIFLHQTIILAFVLTRL